MEGSPGRLRTGTLQSAQLISEKGRRWGILPAYHGWQGDVVETSPQVEHAILAALRAEAERPPKTRRPRVPDEPCAPAPERTWGWAVQLYALRSRESWGVGDLSDLRRFARWSRKRGASVLLVNPLGAQTPTLPYQPSPYYASTRRFRNIVYLRVEEIEGAEGVDIDEEREAARLLNDRRIIDYDEVFRLKSQALEKVFHAAPRPQGFDTYVRWQGTALRDFATFNWACEMHGPAWRSWPQDIGAVHRERVAYHQWLQFHVDRQLTRASREIGLITDVPVGFASDGFDAWRWRDDLATGMRVGAPPDEFFRDGQDWGLPAFNPWRLAGARWEPFIDAIREAARHASGVRLDHVMGLFRLFWIPDGMTAAQGAYVKYPAHALLALLASESRRANAFVIGEDLGLVQPTVRKHLRKKESLSYRLVWFEGSEPARWPHDSVAAVGTHDLPTVAGIWTRSEPEHRLHHLRSMEDALGVHERPNVPGTIDEFPNWRLALPVPLEEVEQADGVRRIVDVMKEAGR